MGNVTSMEIEPFSDEHLADAAVLLAARHARDRAARPLLPEAFEDPQRCERIMAAGSEGSGSVALRDGRLVGFLVATEAADTTRGRFAWSSLGEHALADGEDPELYRDLYAAASQRWVGAGRLEHFVVMPAHDHNGVGMFFEMGFGKQQVHGARRLDEDEPSPAGFDIRRARSEDHSSIARLFDLLGRHHAQPPTYAVFLPEWSAEYLEGHKELLAAGDVGYFVAYEDDAPVAFMVFVPARPSLDTPDGAVELEVAATVAAVRGRGFGTALLRHGIEWARRAGYRACVTDWRSANPASARFWPGRGFAPVAHRLHRSIDARIVGVASESDA